MRTTQEYLALIPPEHAGKPKFVQTVSLAIDPYAQIQAFLATLPEQFDLDTAIGVQLDATGAWIGLSRFIPIPIPNAYFSFDTPGLGFDQGYWFGTFDASPTFLERLDDATYRRALDAKVACNNSNGTIPDIQAVLNAYFPQSQFPNTLVWTMDGYTSPPFGLFFSFDDPLRGFDVGVWYQGSDANFQSVDMSIIVGLSGQWPTVVDLEVLQQQILPFRGAGVFIHWAITTVNGAPVFGLDVENEFISGCDVGAWGASPGLVAGLITA